MSFRGKLPIIYPRLPNLIDLHVKHVFDHVVITRDRVVLGRGHDRTERYRARSCLSLERLVNQQLAFECSNLRVNHAKAVQLTAAGEGEVLYMIGE